MTAVNTFRAADQIGQTGTIEQEALTHLQEHWQDYLAAFEAYPTEPIINNIVPDPATHFEVWLDAGATKLGETLTDAYMAQISATVTQKDILRAWVNKEADAGHWGYKENWAATRKVPYRIVLGGSDSHGSIGFSQIQNRFKYGNDDQTPGLTTVNLYHPADAMKGFAIWSNTQHLGEGFYYAFTDNSFQCTTSFQPGTFPRLGNSYTDQLADRLSKGIAAYKQGAYVGNSVFFKTIWPEILRNYPPSVINGSVQKAVRYALEVKQQAGLSLANRTWQWNITINTSCDYSEQDWFNGTLWAVKCQ